MTDSGLSVSSQIFAVAFTFAPLAIITLAHIFNPAYDKEPAPRKRRRGYTIKR